MNRTYSESPQDRAEQLGLTWIDPAGAVTELVIAMLQDFHRSVGDAGLKARIAAGYEQYVGATLEAFAAGEGGYSGIYFKGPPGHGKSSVVREAGRIVADLVGMRFHDRVKADQHYDQNDLVLVVHELTGEISPLTFRGLWDKEVLHTPSGDRSVMNRIPYKQFEKAREAGLAVLLLDDISSALESVQTSLLGLIQNRESEGHDFSRFFFVLTGNLGAMDGTSVSRGSAALSGRTRMWYFEDELEQFCDRMAGKYADSLGDGYVTPFLRSNPQLFAATAEQLADPDAPRPEPRTWERLIVDMRALLHAWRSSNGTSRMFQGSAGGLQAAIRRRAAGNVGNAIAAAFTSFVDAMMTQAYPLAERMMGTTPDHDAIREVIAQAGDGMKNDGEHHQLAFQSQYAEACATIAAEQILGAEDPLRASADVLRRYFRALNKPHFASHRRANIGIAYQTRAHRTLGARLLSNPHLATSSISARAIGRRLHVPELIESLGRAANECNRQFMLEHEAAPFSRDHFASKVLQPFTLEEMHLDPPQFLLEARPLAAGEPAPGMKLAS